MHCVEGWVVARACRWTCADTQMFQHVGRWCFSLDSFPVHSRLQRITRRYVCRAGLSVEMSVKVLRAHQWTSLATGASAVNDAHL